MSRAEHTEEDLSLPFAQLNMKSSSALIRHVPNAHKDDIHGMVKIDDRIVTGSKDTTVRMWTEEGKFKGLVSKPRNTTEEYYSYGHWITALDIFPDGSVMVGSRNGFVLCKNIYNNKIYYSDNLPKQINDLEKVASSASTNYQSFCKTRNETRIMGITCQQREGYFALIGMAERFVQLNLDTKKIYRVFNFDDSEWVYGFAELDSSRIVAIHGCRLSVFEELEDTPPNNGWEKLDTIVEEETSSSSQRPFISDVNKFQENPSWLALSFFGGMTRVIDVEKREVVHEGTEHGTTKNENRVWKAAPIDASTFLSCADDGLIKLWDVREANSMRTYDGHPGRVSALTLLSNSMFVAGSCPSDPKKDREKAQLFFYDLRR